MGPDIVLTIPRIMLVLPLTAILWLFCSWVVADSLGGKCKHYPLKSTVLDCMLTRNDKQPSHRKKRFVGWLLILLGPVVVAPFIVFIFMVGACFAVDAIIKRIEKSIGL